MPDELGGRDGAAAAERHTTSEAMKSLITEAGNGEWGAWQEIISRYGRLVMHTAMTTGLSRSDAADAAQLTWLRLWEHGHQIREPDRLASWLVSTARREAIRLATGARYYVLSADPSTEHGGSGAGITGDAYAVDEEYDGIVEQALHRLPASYQTLLRLLSSNFELSYSEVARVMGLPIGSIGPMRMRAIRMLTKTPEFTSGSFPRPALTAMAS